MIRERSALGTVALGTVALGTMALALAAIAGCAIDASSNTSAQRCGNDTDCHDPATQTCYRGFCIAREGVDSGPSPDGGRDSGTDAFRPDTTIDAFAPDTSIDAGPDAGMDASGDGGNDASGDGGNWCDGSMGTCMTGQPGVCNAGVYACGTMGSVCFRQNDPTPEACNNMDDDCDGVIDEEFTQRCYPSGTVGCMANADGTFTCVGGCHTGTQTCNTGGSLSACMSPGLPGTEMCQSPTQIGVDEDCNGVIDQNCTCAVGTSRMCYRGDPAQAGIGVCVTGMQTCDATGHWGSCSGDGMPGTETCSNGGADDDCNGILDDVAGRGATCTVPGGVGDCGDGTMQCSGSTLTCQGPAPAAMEACDHHDDDCDGAIDESFDFANDPLNCGACGTVCGTGTSCCNGHCVDESSDAANCSACAMACPTGDTCCSSSCADMQTDENNCGACGHVCNGGELCCAGTCVDPLSSAANCSGCGNACTGSANACCGGVCHTPGATACTMCTVDCTVQTPPQECCGTSCADTQSDEANCGTCGHACASGQVCCAGVCQNDDAAHCGGACVNCGSQLCCNDACVAIDTRHCQACGVSCASGSSCCSDGCHNLASDDLNCGGCGAACTSPTPHCTNSHCCATGLTWCGTSCVNLLTSAQNCGMCGHSCTLGCNGAGMCNLF